MNEYGIYTGGQNDYLPGIMDNTEAFVDADGTRRTKLEEHWKPDKNGWIKLNISDAAPTAGSSSVIQGYDTYTRGVGYSNSFLGYYDTPYIQMNVLGEDYQYEFAFEITNFRSSSVRSTWNGTLSMHTQVYAGSRDYIRDLSESTNPSSTLLNNVSLVSMPSDYYVEKTFSDSTAPEFTSGAPVADVEDISTSVDVALKTGSKGTVYYVLVPQVNPSDLAPTLSYTPEGRDDNKLLWEDVCNIERSYLQTIGGEPWHPSLETPTDGELVEYLSATSESDWTGSLDFINNSTVQTINFEGLDPLTNYYIYFMIEGENSPLSEVYLYKFTTLATERPIYNEMTFDAEANVSFKTHVDANVAYQIINVSLLDSPNTPQFKILNERFYDNLDEEEIRPDVLGYDDITYSAFYADSKYYSSDLTVLDALKTRYTSSAAGGTMGMPTNWSEGHTVFDVYASSELKSAIYDAIYQTVNQNNGSTQSQNTIEDQTVDALIDGTRELEDTFIFLVTGHNQNANTNDPIAEIKSFAALTGIIISDNTRPQLLGITTNASPTTVTDTTFSGTLSLTFDKGLYVWHENKLHFLQTGANHTSPDTSVYPHYEAYNVVGMTSDAGSATKRLTMLPVYSGMATTAATKTLDFKFTNITAGESFYVFNPGVLSSSGGASGPMMTVTFKQVTSTYEVVKGASNTVTNEDGSTTTTTQQTGVTTYEMQWEASWSDGQSVTSSYWTKEVTLADDVVNTPATTSGGVTTNTGTSTNGVTNVSIPSTKSMKVGDSLDLTAVVTGMGSFDSSCTWSVTGGNSSYKLTTDSNDNEIEILGSYPGTYTIKATAGGVTSNECTLTISNPTISVTETTKQSTATGYGVLNVTVGNVGSLSNSGQKSVAWSAGSGVQLSTSTSFSSTSASTTLTDNNNGTWSATVNYKTSQNDAVAVTASFLQVWGIQQSLSISSTLFSASAGGLFS